jgi:hypothetical protein
MEVNLYPPVNMGTYLPIAVLASLGTGVHHYVFTIENFIFYQKLTFIFLISKPRSPRFASRSAVK